MADKKNNNNNNNNEIYEYIKVVDEKVTQNEKTLKFIMSQQSEQMKELIGSKTDNLRKFFEESIRMQMEIVRNAYEEIISELKNTYEKDLKNREIENIKLSNQKEETIKSSYEAQIETIKGFMENDCQRRIDKCYLDTKNKYEEEKKALIEQHKKEMQTTAEKIYNDAKAEFDKELQAIKTGYDKELQAAKTEYDNKLQATKTGYDKELQAAKTEYDDRLAEVKAWDEKNLQNKLAETEDYFRKAQQRVADEAYANGKTDTEAWHDDVVKQKLEVQAQYFQEEMAKQEQYYQGELEKQKNDLKMEAERYFAVEAEKIKAECESVAVEQRQAAVDEVSKSAKREYEEKLADLNIWHNKNLCERLEEVKNYYEKKMLEKEEEHQNIVRQKLEIQANFFDEEIQNAKAQAREETKAELMSQMDEAARRNEEELKLFLDFYEAKIKPFKKLINIHETTDKRIKDIQLRLQNRFNKTFGNK